MPLDERANLLSIHSSHMMRFLTYLTVLFMTAFVAACGGGGGSPGATPNDEAFFTTAPSNLTLRMGTSQSFNLGGGRPPYTAVSNNQSIVVGVVDGSTLTVGGVSQGAATVTVRDDAGATATVGVTVDTPSGLALFSTAPASLTIAPKVVTTYSIGGGVAPYTVSSDNTSVVTVTQSGSNFTVRAVALGSATVQIRDSVGATLSRSVTVANTSLSLNPSEANSLVGFENYAYIIGGVPPYTVLSGFPTAVNATIGTLSGTTFTANASGNVLRMIATQAVDPAQVVVTDANGSSVNFELTAAPGSGTFTFAPTTLEIAEGFTGEITLLLFGATAGSVNVFTTFPDLISVVTTPVTAAGGTQATAVTLNASGGLICATGAVVITAVDSVGATATAEITIVDDVSKGTCE